MSVLARLAGFAAVLAAVFGVAALAGGVLDPSAPAGRAEAAGEPEGHGAGAMAPMPVRGLAVADGGLRLALADPELRRGRTQPLEFRILGRDGRPVRDFELAHTKRMHLILARRDLTGFQHLHPTMRPDGTWTTPLRLRDPGSYRVFADFERGGTPRTLASDLRVDGRADLRALPAPATTARTDGGYEVRLAERPARAGRESELRFTVTKDGRPVRTQRYLGAGGHLVALREGDLAFLHVHPAEHDGVSFEATFPTAGAYRLFLQFKADGKVRTAAFTQEVGR